MLSNVHATLLMLIGFVCGIFWGMYLGKEQYRRLLVLLAKSGSAEKLPDGKFYYLKREGGQHGTDT